MGSGAEHERRVEELAQSNDAAALIDALDEPKACWHTRAAAIASLVRLGAAHSAPAILKLLAREADPDTREACIDALATFRFARARRVLERLAEGEGSVAARARDALTRF
jgi:HEAT repeat protein